MKRELLFHALLLATSSAFAANTATLSWTAPSAHLDGTPITGALTYSIYQGVGVGSTKTKASTATTTTSTISTGLNSGTTYCWQVTAQEGTGAESAMSNEACKTFPASPPQAPTGLTAQ
jgi:Fibronectin type III domain